MVEIPHTLDEVGQRLTGIEAVLTAQRWERAAIVWAFTLQRDDLSLNNEQKISFREFSRLGISGLTSDVTVAHYHDSWQKAINSGHAKPVEPGDRIEIPDLTWPPRERYYGKIKDDAKRDAVDAAARGEGVARDMVAYVRENGSAIAAAIKADPKIAQRAADALAESTQGRLAALGAMRQLDEQRLRERVVNGATPPAPAGEPPMAWAVALRKAIALAEEAASAYNIAGPQCDERREFAEMGAKRLIAAGEWLLSVLVDNGASDAELQALLSEGSGQ